MLLSKLLYLAQCQIRVYFLVSFLAHLVYQPKSLVESCFVRHWHWCWHWHHHHLYTPPPGTGLDIETSY